RRPPRQPAMRRRAAIAVLVLCVASSPARPQGGSAAVPSQEEVELTADRIVYDWEQRKLLLEGHVVATRGPAIVRAARGSLDRRTGILRLEGGVMAVQGRQVLVTESAEVKIEDGCARLCSPHLGLLGASIPLLLPLSLPLTERQTGLLFPPFQYSAISGFGTEVPLFLPLGRSYDATVAPGFFTG